MKILLLFHKINKKTHYLFYVRPDYVFKNNILNNLKTHLSHISVFGLDPIYLMTEQKRLPVK